MYTKRSLAAPFLLQKCYDPVTAEEAVSYTVFPLLRTAFRQEPAQPRAVQAVHAVQARLQAPQQESPRPPVQATSITIRDRVKSSSTIRPLFICVASFPGTVPAQRSRAVRVRFAVLSFLYKPSIPYPTGSDKGCRTEI